MHHPRAGGAGGLGDRFRALGLHGVKGLRAALGQDADQIDGDMGIAHRGLDRGRVAQIGLHGVDLADPAERLQVPGQFRPPHRDPDAVIALGQRADHVSPQKARSAENRDERFRFDANSMPWSIPAGQIREIAGVFSGFAIRQHAAAVQRIWLALKQFDKRATDPY